MSNNPPEEAGSPDTPEQPDHAAMPEPQIPPMPPVQPPVAGGYVPPVPPPHIPQYAPVPPIPAGWQPPPPAGGKIWLGILLGAGVPILCFILGNLLTNAGIYGIAGFLMALPFWLMLILAIVLTVIRSQRRTGIGMWIGLAALPIIGFGACMVLIFGVAGGSF